MKNLLLFSTLILGALPGLAQVTTADLVKADPNNWLTYQGSYDAKRHSLLNQINAGNAKTLMTKWVYHVPGAQGLEGVPIVVNNIMYVGQASGVIALDARTGRVIWNYQRTGGRGKNRGVAVYGNKVFTGAAGGFLVALDMRTGAVIWETKLAGPAVRYQGIAPLVIKDKVIMGVHTATGGSVDAYDTETGKHVWAWNVVPKAGEPGSETWQGDSRKFGGGPTWVTGTFDPELNLIFWGTGQPLPDFDGDVRKGDNLFTECVVALDADSGKMKWYFQFTPHDTHDWDAQSWPVLLDMPVQGRMRKVVVHANRNGFFYVLDRATGEFLRATPYVELNWAKGVDAKGRPIVLPDTDPTPDGRRVCPNVRGASNWMSPSFNPDTGLFYVSALEACDVYTSSTKKGEPMKGYGGTGTAPSGDGKFYMRALDPKTGEKRWEYPMTGTNAMWAGTVSTAGGVLFFGDDDGQLVALDSKTGKHLWHFYLGQNLTASPITFSVDGKQYVTLAAATDVVTFGLFEPTVSVPVVPERIE
jgi:alcohol dehydrogenase (cytochrome c)